MQRQQASAADEVIITPPTESASEWAQLAQLIQAGEQRGWQARMHRVAAGQALWLDVRAGQWLQVCAGTLQLGATQARQSQLHARWAMSEMGDASRATGAGHMGGADVLQAGEVMAVHESARWGLRAHGEAVLLVWQPLAWPQRLLRRLRAMRAQPSRTRRDLGMASGVALAGRPTADA
jgi:hypothetical protein